MQLRRHGLDLSKELFEHAERVRRRVQEGPPPSQPRLQQGMRFGTTELQQRVHVDLHRVRDGERLQQLVALFVQLTAARPEPAGAAIGPAWRASRSSTIPSSAP